MPNINEKLNTQTVIKDSLISALTMIQTKLSKIETTIQNGLTPVFAKMSMSKAEADDEIELNEENIQKRIEGLADLIIAKHKEECPIVLLSVLEGAKPFASALEAAIKRKDPSFNFKSTSIQTSSYVGNESGEVKVYAFSDKLVCANKVVIILDEVCDTGKTLKKLIDLLKTKGAKEIYTAVLVDKKQDRLLSPNPQDPEEFQQFDPDYVGCVVDKDEFIVGWGLDYNEAFRDGRSIQKVNLDTLPEKSLEKELRNREKVLAAELEKTLANINALTNKKAEKKIKVSQIWCGFNPPAQVPLPHSKQASHKILSI